MAAGSATGLTGCDFRHCQKSLCENRLKRIDKLVFQFSRIRENVTASIVLRNGVGLKEFGNVRCKPLVCFFQTFSTFRRTVT